MRVAKRPRRWQPSLRERSGRVPASEREVDCCKNLDWPSRACSCPEPASVLWTPDARDKMPNRRGSREPSKTRCEPKSRGTRLSVRERAVWPHLLRATKSRACEGHAQAAPQGVCHARALPQLTLVGAFDFRPGATGGMYPASRQRMPSIFLPSLNWIEWHMMISPLADNSSRRVFTLARESPVPVAISASSRSPLLFRYWMMSCNLDSPSWYGRAWCALVVAGGFGGAGQNNSRPDCPPSLLSPANDSPTLRGVC